MNIIDLKNFILVSRLGSFTKAADELYISQQKISYSIRKLEEHYGTQLFKRRPKVVLTDDGKKVLSFAKQVVSHDERLVQNLSLKKENISLGIQEDQSIHFLPYLISEMKSNYPNVQLSLIHDGSERLEKMVENDEIQYATTINTPKRGTLHVEKIIDLNLNFIVSNKLLYKYHDLYGFDPKSKQISLEDICEIPIMLIKGRQAELIKEAFGKANLKPKIAIEVNSGTIARNLLYLGEYGSIIPLLDNRKSPDFSSYEIVTNGQLLSEEIDLIFNKKILQDNNISKVLYNDIKKHILKE